MWMWPVATLRCLAERRCSKPASLIWTLISSSACWTGRVSGWPQQLKLCASQLHFEFSAQHCSKVWSYWANDQLVFEAFTLWPRNNTCTHIEFPYWGHICVHKPALLLLDSSLEWRATMMYQTLMTVDQMKWLLNNNFAFGKNAFLRNRQSPTRCVPSTMREKKKTRILISGRSWLMYIFIHIHVCI